MCEMCLSWYDVLAIDLFPPLKLYPCVISCNPSLSVPGTRWEACPLKWIAATGGFQSSSSEQLTFSLFLSLPPADQPF